MMIDNEPNVTILEEGEAIACWPAFGFSVLHIGKRVVAGVDRGGAVYADQLLSKADLERGEP
jgi:hypothetical protein